MKTLFVFCFGFGTATTKTFFLWNHQKTFQNQNLQKHPFIFSTTFTKRIRVHGRFPFWHHQKNNVETYPKPNGLYTWKHFTLDLFGGSCECQVKTPFQRIYRLPKKSGHIKNPQSPGGILPLTFLVDHSLSSQNTLLKSFISQRFHNNGTISKTHMVFRLPGVILLKLKWQTVPGNKVHGTV